MNLPYFIPPMLAVHGQPFDAEDYIFELKLDGYRTIMLRDEDSYRLMSRNSIDMTGEFTELSFLRSIPPGTVLDGELVAMRNGKPDFQSLRSHVTRRSSKIVYFAFDILYENYEPRMELPLMERKRILESVAGPYVREGFSINTFTDTYGKLFFEKVKIEGLEGIMAKQKNSLYFPGKREDTWKKIKTRSEMLCVVIGFVPKENEFKSLILASEINGKLRYVGKVGTGFSNKQKSELYNALRILAIEEPIVPCPEEGVWIKPEIFCDIAYSELTHDNVLRAPVFKSIVR